MFVICTPLVLAGMWIRSCVLAVHLFWVGQNEKANRTGLWILPQ